MSDNITYVVDTEVSLEEAPALAQRVIDSLCQRGIILPTPQVHELHEEGSRYARGPNVREAARCDDWFPCGLDVTIERGVYSPVGNGTDSLTCPECGHIYEADDIDFITAIDEWWEKPDSGFLLCSHCKKAPSITTWKFEPEWGFGNLAFGFSNWYLKPEFVEEMTRLLGHRVAAVESRI